MSRLKALIIVGVFLFCLGVLVACDPNEPLTQPTRNNLAAPPTKPTGRISTPTPTPLPPLPTATQTAVPRPSPTYDPGLAEWTLLIYLDADNNLEQAGLLDLQEMEAAGSSEEVNVLVQIDRAIGETAAADNWSEARRYRIRADTDPMLIDSELLMALGERNMGDPAELAQFIEWGITFYPANRYGLIIWDHGAGWNGIAFDNDAANAVSGDHLTLQDLKVGLETALAAVQIDKLDVVGFDACLMGQLDVFNALQPYAKFGVGSEELTPGLGWDYTTLLSHLYGNSGMDGPQLSHQMVTDFMHYYTEVEPDGFVTMSAVDLSRLPTLTRAVSELAHRLTAVSVGAASAVGDARSGAESFARVYANDYERYAAIDLHHFASILAQRSPDERVIEAAAAVMTAVEKVVLVHRTGNAFKHSGGIAVYFPRNTTFYNAEYQQISTIPAWDRFLNSYFAVGFTAVPPPELRINNVLRQEVGIQNPAFVDFDIVGREIENVIVQAIQIEETGRQRLVEYDNLIPEPTTLADGSQLFEWRDGVHEDFFVWNTVVTYIFDSFDNQDVVVMWPTEFGSSLFTVQGQFQRADTGEQWEANLVFDHANGELTRVWGYQSEAKTGVAELFVEEGDSFRLTNFYLDQDDQLRRELGATLVFDAQKKIYFDRRPLPSGSYMFGFMAENVAGDTSADMINLTVENEEIVADFQAYLDPYLGFQFLYPTAWYRPVYDDSLLYTSHREETQQFQLTLFPNLSPDVDLLNLQGQVLSQFGSVSLLFEDDIQVADTPARRVAYGYQQSDGTLRTGLFFIFIKDGMGYVIDVDGAREVEAETIAVVDQMIDSWKFAPPDFSVQPGRWSTLQFDNFSVAQPANFVYSEFNDWQRFSSGQHTFVALRTRPFTGDVQASLERLLDDAALGIQSFEAEPPYRFGLGGHIWDRVDFAYTAADGVTIWGYIMLRIEAGQEIVAWAEAPSTIYNQTETAVFLTMIADLDAR